MGEWLEVEALVGAVLGFLDTYGAFGATHPRTAAARERLAAVVREVVREVQPAPRFEVLTWPSAVLEESTAAV